MGLARLGSAYLARLCRLEKRLFLSFFYAPQGDDDADDYASASSSSSHSKQQQQAERSAVKAMTARHLEGLHLMLVDLCQVSV